MWVIYYDTIKIIKENHALDRLLFESKDKLAQTLLKDQNSILLVHVFPKKVLKKGFKMGLELCYNSSWIIPKQTYTNPLFFLGRPIYLSMMLTVATRHSRNVGALKTDERFLSIDTIIVNTAFDLWE